MLIIIEKEENVAYILKMNRNLCTSYLMYYRFDSCRVYTCMHCHVHMFIPYVHHTYTYIVTWHLTVPILSCTNWLLHIHVCTVPVTMAQVFTLQKLLCQSSNNHYKQCDLLCMITITDNCVNIALQGEENHRNLTHDEVYDISDACLHCLADQNILSRGAWWSDKT